jgi:hypothetical protein
MVYNVKHTAGDVPFLAKRMAAIANELHSNVITTFSPNQLGTVAGSFMIALLFRQA